MKQFNPTMLEKLDKMDFVKFAITTPDASRLVLHMHVREEWKSVNESECVNECVNECMIE